MCEWFIESGFRLFVFVSPFFLPLVLIYIYIVVIEEIASGSRERIRVGQKLERNWGRKDYLGCCMVGWFELMNGALMFFHRACLVLFIFSPWGLGEALFFSVASFPALIKFFLLLLFFFCCLMGPFFLSGPSFCFFVCFYSNRSCTCLPCCFLVDNGESENEAREYSPIQSTYQV